MLDTDTINFTIGSWMLPAIINGDYSGLEAGDMDDVQYFDHLLVEFCPEGYRFGHIATTGDTNEFGQCEISRLYGTVERVQAVYFKAEN